MTTPRFMPMVGDSMAPTVPAGDFVAVLPASSYASEGLYVIDVLGAPNVVRVHHIGCGELAIRYDNPAYSGGVTTVEKFKDVVLGKVFAVCSVIDRAVIDGAGLDAWRGTGRVSLDGSPR